LCGGNRRESGGVEERESVREGFGFWGLNFIPHTHTILEKELKKNNFISTNKLLCYLASQLKLIIHGG
jgi:hypothetical protein